MTSRKSFRNPAVFTFGSNVKKHLFVSAGIAALLFVYYGSIWRIIGNYRYALKHTPSVAQEFRDYVYVFRTDISEVPLFEFFISVLMILFAFLLSLFIFRFMMSKASSNVYFSLGISRGSLFSSLYLSGLCVLAIGVAVPVLTVTAANLAFFGPSRELFFEAVYILVKIASSLFYVFTAISMAQVLLGSVFESVVMGSVCVCAPGLLTFIIRTFSSFLVYGSPYLGVIRSDLTFKELCGEIIDKSDWLYDFQDYLFPVWSDINMVSGASLKVSERIANKGDYLPGNFIGPLVFLAVILILAAVCRYLFKRRKAEKAGFMGTCPALEGFCVVIVGSALTALFIETVAVDLETSYFAKCLITFIAGIVIMSVGYTVVDLISVRSLKAFRKRFKNLLIELLIFAIIFSVFKAVIPAFDRLPARDEIVSAGVTVNNDALGEVNDTYSKYTVFNRDDVSDFLGYSSVCYLTKGFTSPEDIGVIYDVNLAVEKEAGKAPAEKSDNADRDSMTVPSAVRFEYELKNGRKYERLYYAASVASLKKLMSLCKSEHYIDVVAGALSPGGNSYEKLQSDDIGVCLYSADYSNRTYAASLSGKAEKGELISAVGADIKDGTLPLDYVSDSPLSGYISFEYKYIDDDTPDKDTKIVADAISDTTSSLAYFPVYANMKHTLDCIGKNNMAGCFESTAVPERVRYCRMNPDYSQIQYGNIGMFCGKSLPSPTLSDFDEFGNENTYSLIPEDAKTATSQTEISELLNGMRMRYPIFSEGRLVEVAYGDGTFIYAFVPD
ncbi:MAG: hypothetical protein K6F64_06550 [Clostridia bacterium]|nr:hypothetical protein [Clostridia bacterium]